MRRKIPQICLVIAGIVLGQAVLYGPSLMGRKLLLPLDVLAASSIYLPPAQAAGITPHNMVLSDLVFLFEPERRFAVAELHAGRMPLWAPYHFSGAPFIWPKFSPLLLPGVLIQSPVILAWVQLWCALAAGTGMYYFCRRVLGIGPWPATVVAWSYPLTYFFILSQGFTLILSVYWFPWVLSAVDAVARRRERCGLIGLSLATAFTALSGQLDMAGEVLLVSGGFGIWAWRDEFGKRWRESEAGKALLRMVMGWTLGLMLAAPYVLPVLDYAQTGARVSNRSLGAEERPPAGLAAAPQILLPKIYGSSERGDIPLYPKEQHNLQESSAGAYAGLLAACVAAPLAFCSRPHKSISYFLLGLSLLGVCWSLNVPIAVSLMRLPGLNLMSFNRLVFASGFSILALAGIGLETLGQGGVHWKPSLWVPTLGLLGLCAWCGYRAVVLPEPLRTELEAGLKQGLQSRWVRDLREAGAAKALFSRNYGVAALLAGWGAVIWLCLRWRVPGRQLIFWAVGGSMILDLVWHDFGRASQCEPALYYPRLPVLEKLAKSPAGRVIGFSCLPALLPSTQGLMDVRGYDPVVPGRMLDLLKTASDPRSTVFAYGLAQRLTPMAAPTAEGGIQLPPVLDMLNVRYVIFRGAPNPTDHPMAQGPDYFVLLNRSAGERAYVPARVEVVTDDAQRLAKLAAAEFDPNAIALVESPVELPGQCRGEAKIVNENPRRVTLNLRMETAGLVVLADTWDHGWKAYLNGSERPILRTNHAIRGVVAPPGTSTLEFRYEPASFAVGVWLAGVAAVGLLVWGIPRSSRLTTVTGSPAK
jgi:hypothetical protein